MHACSLAARGALYSHLSIRIHSCGALRGYLEEELTRAKAEQLMVSLHLKA